MKVDKQRAVFGVGFVRRLGGLKKLLNLWQNLQDKSSIFLREIHCEILGHRNEVDEWTPLIIKRIMD